MPFPFTRHSSLATHHSTELLIVQRRIQAALRQQLVVRAGFDATQGQSMCVVPPPGDRPSSKAVVSEKLLANILFLPFYPELTPTESQRMAEVVLAGTNHSCP